MWFFQTASNADMIRLKKAVFEHMGIIPQGVKFVTKQERYTPDYNLIQMAFGRNKELISNSSMSYTQDMGKGDQPLTATETMARVNATQTMAANILDLSYTYENFKYIEMVRRLCLPNNPDPRARRFRLLCLEEGLPEKMLDPERWFTEPEQIVGGGSKTVQMAAVGFLNSIRPNLPPRGQRLVDHISVEAATDQPDLAEEMAPLAENEPISDSMHDAQLATNRLLLGLPFVPPKAAILEDYVKVWLHDLSLKITEGFQKGGMVPPEELAGLENLANNGRRIHSRDGAQPK